VGLETHSCSSIPISLFSGNSEQGISASSRPSVIADHAVIKVLRSGSRRAPEGSIVSLGCPRGFTFRPELNNRPGHAISAQGGVNWALAEHVSICLVYARRANIG
jgi:hypothetical protein